MKVLKIFRIGCGLLLFTLAFAGGTETKKSIKLNDQLSAGLGITKSGIQIAPIYLTSPEYALNFLSLEEANQAGAINLTETGNVNQLLVENLSKKPILLLAGEVLEGGKQNRMIGKDLILAPGKTRRIEVFCVEQGRWVDTTAGSGKFQSAGIIADKEIRQKAQAKGGSAGNQSLVWGEVQRALSAFSAEAPTSNYQEITKAEKYQTAEQLIKSFQKAFANDKQIAGFVVAYNNKVQTLEYFANPELLAKYQDNLLRAYVLSGIKNLQKSEPVSEIELKNFVNQKLTESHQSRTEDEIVIEQSGDTLENFELRTPQGKLVHYLRYAKDK